MPHRPLPRCRVVRNLIARCAVAAFVAAVPGARGLADDDRESAAATAARTGTPHEGESVMIHGLATVIYHVPDLDHAKAWYAAAFRTEPYFDQPFYVGFDIGGFELGLDPDGSISPPGAGGTVAYWRVDEIDAAVRRFVAAGALLRSPAKDVGEGIQVAVVADPFGNAIGLIENPHFGQPRP